MSSSPTDPDYYAKASHQQWDIAYELWGPGALLAHALKYIMRAGRKPGASMAQDVRKAINYLEHLEKKLGDATEQSSPEAVEPDHVHVFENPRIRDRPFWADRCMVCGAMRGYPTSTGGTP